MMFNNENIVYKNNGDIEYIQFKKLLKYGIKHAYTLKGKNLDFSKDAEAEKSSYSKLCNAIRNKRRNFSKANTNTYIYCKMY